MKTYIKKLVFLPVVAVALLSACIREDMKDCPPKRNVRLFIVTDTEVPPPLPNGRMTYLDRYVIDSVSVYVFDESERFFMLLSGGFYTMGNHALGKTYELPIWLEDGTYHFVAWTNQGGIYKTNFETKDDLYRDMPHMGAIHMRLDFPTNAREIRTDIPDLHHGMTRDQQIIERKKDNTVTVVVSPNTYKVNFTVKGLGATGNEFDFSVTDRNGHSRGMNNVITPGGGDFHYIRTCNATTGEMNVSMIMLNLSSVKNMPFTLTNETTHEGLFSGDLINLIVQSYQNAGQALDFSKIFEFDIVLTYIANVGVTVTVNTWNYSNNPIEL